MSKRTLDIILLEQPELLEEVWGADTIQYAQNEYIELFKEIKELGKLAMDNYCREVYSEIGKAITHLAQTDYKHGLLRYLKYVDGRLMLPDGDGAYDITLLDWYKEEK